MLVLARKPNQSIMIGDNVEVRIIEVRGDQVKVGIEAPKNIEVYRKEVYEDIKAANQEAISSSADNIKNISNFNKMIKIKKKDKKDNQ